MSTPTAVQTIRSGARRLARESGDAHAAFALIDEALTLVPLDALVGHASGGLMGAKDVGARLGMAVPNIGKTAATRDLRPIDRISDGRPVYAWRDVERVAAAIAAAKAEREV